MIFFDDLLRQGDFTGNVERLSHPVRKAHGFPLLHQLGLLEPLEGSAFYRNSLDPEGRTVVQHLGFLVEDVDIWAKKLKPAGIGVWVRGQLKTGALITDFVYMNPGEDDGLIMEFISWKLFGRTLTPAPGIAHTIGRIQQWSRKRCWSL